MSGADGPIDELPKVESFLGLDLRTGCMIIAALGIVHPMAYGCTFFMPLSYLMLTVWIMLTLYFCASAMLIYAIEQKEAWLCTIWIWYALVFVFVMLLMMVLLAIVFTSRGQGMRVCVVILGVAWYVAHLYFIIVVNSFRKTMASKGDSRLEDYTD